MTTATSGDGSTMVQLLRDDVETRPTTTQPAKVPTRLVAIALIVLVAALLVLKILGLAYREIYPAVIFPGFARLPAGAAETDDEIRIQKVQLVAGDRTLELTAEEAFPEPLNSFYLPMLESLVEAEATPSLQDWAQATWLTRTGDEVCVTGLAVYDVVVADEAQRRVLNELVFPPCQSDQANG